MSKILRPPQKIQTDEQSEKYFSFQIKGWTNFDPMDMTLARIAEGIEQGGGFVSLMEVLKVEDDLASIGDEEVRECFANVLAAKRLLRNAHELPKNLIEELCSALKTEDEVAPKKTVTPVAISSVDDEPGSHAGLRWP
jgi:hypothetical protein